MIQNRRMPLKHIVFVWNQCTAVKEKSVIASHAPDMEDRPRYKSLLKVGLLHLILSTAMAHMLTYIGARISR